MVKIELIVRPGKLKEVEQVLSSRDVEITMISDVCDHSVPPATHTVYRGSSYGIEIMRTKVELLAPSERADEIVDQLLGAIRTGSAEDDGTILVYEVADAVRIRTGTRLQYTLH